MSYELFAERELAQALSTDLYTRIQVLACDLADDKTNASKQHQRLIKRYAQYAKQALTQMKNLALDKPDTEMVDSLIPGSFCLTFQLKLARPLMSKDDPPFYICDNPMRKDPVFRIPMMSATGWKGCFRAALYKQGYDGTHPLAQCLLGRQKGEDDNLNAGRLQFFPTFFDNLSIEVINPHSRKTKAGTLPIYFECVPSGTTGAFSLLYVPFDLTGCSKAELGQKVADDLEIVASTLQAMLTLYGFGAKTSSGYGVTQDRLVGEGRLVLKFKPEDTAVAIAASPEPQHSGLAQYLESPTRLIADLRRPDGSPKSEADYKALLEQQGLQYNKQRIWLYGKAVKWWEREGKELAAAAPQEPELPPTETPPTSAYSFYTLTELGNLAQHVASALRKEVSDA